jgi:hypothetical protein
LQRTSAEVPDKALNKLAQALSDWTLTPSGSEGYKKAEVTLGGVDTRDLSSQTMESRQPGLYFIGEVVDVTGWLGGTTSSGPGPAARRAPQHWPTSQALNTAPVGAEPLDFMAIISGFVGKPPSAKY